MQLLPLGTIRAQSSTAALGDCVAAIYRINTQGATLSIETYIGCRVRDSPCGLWPVDRLQPFCLNPGLDKPSIRPQFTLHGAEGEKRSRMINVPSVWSVSFIGTHTQSRGSDVYSHSRMTFSRTATYAGVCTLARTVSQKHVGPIVWWRK